MDGLGNDIYAGSMKKDIWAQRGFFSVRAGLDAKGILGGLDVNLVWETQRESLSNEREQRYEQCEAN